MLCFCGLLIVFGLRLCSGFVVRFAVGFAVAVCWRLWFWLLCYALLGFEVGDALLLLVVV